jgi:hypothetical protein
MVGDRRRHQRAHRDAGEDRLPALGREFEQDRARAHRQRQRWEAVRHEPDSPAATRAAQTWSATVDQALHTAEIISREPAHGLAGLVVKFDAAWWWIIEDDTLLDDRARVWLMRFRRSLHRLARNK